MPNLPRPGNRVSVQKWVLIGRVRVCTEDETEQRVEEDVRIVFCDYSGLWHKKNNKQPKRSYHEILDAQHLRLYEKKLVFQVKS